MPARTAGGRKPRGRRRCSDLLWDGCARPRSTRSTTRPRPDRLGAGCRVPRAGAACRSTGAGCASRWPSCASAMSFLGAIGTSLGSVAAGRLAEDATGPLLVALAVCVVGAAMVDTVAKTALGGRRRPRRGPAPLRPPRRRHGPAARRPDRAGGRRGARPDRRRHLGGRPAAALGGVEAARTLLASGPLWLVAGLTWWPAAFLFPLTAVAAVLVVRRLLPRISELKVVEEMAWTDHAAATEEGVAARDDLRTSLGQAHVLRRNARLTAAIHDAARRGAAGRGPGDPAQRRPPPRRAGRHRRPRRGRWWPGATCRHAALVTLFLVTTTFVGQVDMLARHLPDLQEGFGAVLRLRGMMAARAEPDRRATAARRSARRGVPRPALPLRRRHVRPARHRPARAGRAHLRPGRAHGLRQVDAGVAALAGGRARARHGAARRRRRARARPAGAARRRRRRHPAHRDPGRHARREHHALRRRTRGRRSRPPSPSWASPTGSPGCRDGLDTELGPGGTSLSAGEEQLVAFARLLVRDVRVVVLDEATARMDPVTEARVVRAADRLISGRTGPPGRAPAVDDPPRRAGRRPRGRARRAAAAVASGWLPRTARSAACSTASADRGGRGRADRPTTTPASARSARSTTPAAAAGGATTAQPDPRDLARPDHRAAVGPGRHGAVPAVRAHRRLRRGHRLGLGPGRHRPAGRRASGRAHRRAGRLARWSVRCCSRRRSASTRAGGSRCGCGCAPSSSTGRRAQHRLERTPPGEVVARTMDADRLARYADRWVDFVNGLVIVAGHRAHRRHLAGRAGAARRDGQLGGRLLVRPPRRRPVGGGVLDGARRVRPLAGLGPRVGADGQAGGGDPRACTPTCGRSTRAGWTRRCASTGCRRCSTASRS